jgi:methionyl-tRNA formyltransferase
LADMARIVFMGTPDFAVPTLRALARHFEVVGVVTQPDRPAGRGRHVRRPSVAQVADELGLPVFQPKTLRAPEAVAHLAAWQPDMIVVAAFGQILRPEVFDLPPYGTLNVHASLLPRWRGAAPIQHAIRAGDAQTGVTIMLVDAGMDTGPTLSQRAIPIRPEETGASLHDRLAELGAELLIETLPGYLAGDIKPRPQPEEGVTLAPSLSKQDGEIDWTLPAEEIDRMVRAYDPWPGTFTCWGGDPLKVLAGAPLEPVGGPDAPGRLVVLDDALVVWTGRGLYRLDRLQPSGKGPMSGKAFVAGRPEAPGSRLG